VSGGGERVPLWLMKCFAASHTVRNNKITLKKLHPTLKSSTSKQFSPAGLLIYV
jgi:hypothetical protein